MINKCIIIVLSGIAGILIGKLISKNLIIKHKYAKDVLLFCDYFKNEMVFKQTKLFSIIENYDFTSQELKCDLLNFLNSKKEGRPVLINKIFDTQHQMTFKEFFQCLGRFDINTQIEILDMQRENLQDISKNLEIKVKKESALYVKLGFLFGVCVGVLMI